MKELLIIRSVSFQQLDLNLPEIKNRFKDYKISLLTHEHGVKLAEKYNDINNIYVYPYRGSFNKNNTVQAINNKTFDAVIVPVTNITGYGFLNVLSYGSSLKCKDCYMCNVVSNFESISKYTIITKQILSRIYKFTAVFLSIPIILFAAAFLPFKLKKLEANKGGYDV
jgi:hypothetical protein